MSVWRTSEFGRLAGWAFSLVASTTLSNGLATGMWAWFLLIGPIGGGDDENPVTEALGGVSLENGPVFQNGWQQRSKECREFYPMSWTAHGMMGLYPPHWTHGGCWW